VYRTVTLYLGVTVNPTAWNLEELRARVRRSRADADQVLELLSSIGRSVQIFRYHIATARDALKGIVSEAEPQGQENFMLVLGASERQGEFAHAQIVSEANIIGCLHTARSLWDLFAQLVNALIIVHPLAVSACNLERVVAVMPASPLKDRLDVLLASHWYTYVAAFTNTTKHRRLVQHVMTVSMEENRAGVRIGAFPYGSKRFESYWGIEVLEGAIEVKNAVIECGRLLSTAYLNDDAQPSDGGEAPRPACS
jgi:hypothetical protein